ncbi:chorismate-binding protein [Arthrobacter sp. Sa2BUA2]|uniref:Chorismate-binding protein n=1 Tax=Arthrobacter pullicola TaxID=2762224 RepID=A0ABR8YKD2_9MICC|nr:chorismate-binding protein [Arthrobacter pullicola]MBD8044607.1 chorismate-binding protein [Arthrobacter pullicola]
MSPATKRPLLIAVDGFSGAGKTSLALELAAELRAHRSVAVFHLEDVYPGWDGLDAGMDYYRRRVLEPLAQGRSAHWQSWDWVAGRYSAQHATEPADIVIFEGVGAGHRSARNTLDAVLWIQAPESVRRERALARDGETYAPHWDRWAAQEAAWAAGDPVSSAADVLVQSEPTAPPSTVDNDGDGQGPAQLQQVPQPQTAQPQVPLPRLVLRALASLQLPSPGLGLARPDLHVQAHTLDGTPDPLALFAELYGGSPNAVWLDSSDAATAGAGGSPPGRSRFSIMADDGGLLGRYAEHTAGLTRITHGPVTTVVPGPFFRWLDREWGEARVPAPDGMACPFALGWLGFLGYELKRETGGADVAGPGPDAALVFAGRAVILDHAAGRVHLLTLQDSFFDTFSGGVSGHHQNTDGDAADPDEGWLARASAAVATASRTAEAAAARSTPAQTPAFPPGSAPAFAFRDSREAYLAKVLRSQQEIAEGNTYEVCLTTALYAGLPEPLAAEALLDLYAALRRRSPAPFASLLRLGPITLAGTSPERFLRVGADGRLRAEPIKGTRPRGQDPAADAALRRELLASDKDRAENIMIVDLMRNDLSRLAVAGSVTVPRLCVVESYATVHQLVSTIDAQLLPDASRAEAVAAAFPAGSMTGAPKASTMAILDELEAAPRGAYSGAVGYFSLTGAADLSVVIRTLVLSRSANGGVDLSLGVGGAVTAGSDPEAEWEEVRTKARGVLGALGSEVPAG